MTAPIPIGPVQSFVRRLWFGWKDLDGLTRLLLVLAVVMWAMLFLLTVAPAIGAEPDTEIVRCRFRVTAYDPGPCCCSPHADGITASGTRADHPLVAAPACIPFGTRMRIPGYAGGRWVSVEDRGGAITGGRLDVMYATHAEALRWGVKDLWVEVEVPKEGA